MPSNNLVTPKVKVPYFFKIKKNNKENYLLGSMHYMVPVSALPSQVLEVMKICKNMVTEKTDDPLDNEQFFSITIKRKEDSKNWTEDLPMEVKAFAKKTCEEFIKKLAPNNPKWHYRLEELEMWAAYYFYWQACMEIYAQHVEIDESIDYCSMDEELMLEWFNDTLIEGLEGYMDRIPNYKNEAKNMNVFIEIFNNFQKINSFERGEAKIEAEAEEIDAENTRIQKLGGYAECYINGDNLFDWQLGRIISFDEDANQRNIAWIPNIIKHHNNLPGPVLFCVGIIHLTGNQGLLTLLKRAGFEIERLGPNKFESYEYPYNEESILKNSLASQFKTLGWMREMIINKDNQSLIVKTDKKNNKDSR